jgi:hypothetical protein
MEAVKTFLEIVGLITTAVSILVVLATATGWAFGIAPLMYRLGLGRWSRKIDIAAEGTTYTSLRADLIESGVFREKNIQQISKSTLSNAKDANLMLVHYGSFTETEIKTIVSNKKSSAGMVVYFPDFSPTNRIPEDVSKLINNEPHSVLVNFRGRLINDILVTLLSTSYEKK